LANALPISKIITNAFSSLVLLSLVSACATTANEQLTVDTVDFKANANFGVLWVKPCVEAALGDCGADDFTTSKAGLAIHGGSAIIDIKQLYENDEELAVSISRNDATFASGV